MLSNRPRRDQGNFGVRSNANPDSDCYSDVVTYSMSDRGNPLLDFVDSDGPAGPNPPELAMRYLTGPGLDQLFAQEDASGNVVKITTYVTDMAYRVDLAPIREAYLGKKGPASTLVEISSLAHPDWMIEIEAIAVL